MIEVRIRHIDAEQGLIVNDFMPDDIDNLIHVIKRYGCYSASNMCQFLSAQFVADKDMTTKVYFEITVEDEEE